MATQPPPGPTGSSKNGDRGIETEGHKSWNGRVATGVYKHEPEPQTDQASFGKKKKISENKPRRPGDLQPYSQTIYPHPTPADTGSLQNSLTPKWYHSPTS